MTQLYGAMGTAFSGNHYRKSQIQDVQFQGVLDRFRKKTDADEVNLIHYNQQGQMQVPDEVEIPFIEGDGIGKEIMTSARQVVDEAVRLAYDGKRSIRWMPLVAGEQALSATNKDLIPEATRKAIDRHHVAVKGPLNTPVGKGFRSINVQLRSMFDLYACIRPVKTLPEVPTTTIHKNIDTVIFRENTEDVYRGIEFENGSQDAKDLIAFLKSKGFDVPADSGIGVKPISHSASKRIVEEAIEYALEHGRKSITVVHKANIQKFTDGLFLNVAREVAQKQYPDKVILQEDFEKQYAGDYSKLPAGKVVLKDRIADAILQDIILNPTQHDVVVTTNMMGDLLSDGFAALVGGLGLAPGANIGNRHAIFESVHGTAPDIAGQNKANPTALLLSMKMMLDYLDWDEASALLQKGIEKTFANQQMTGDLARYVDGATALGTKEFADAILKNIRILQPEPEKGLSGFLKRTFGRGGDGKNKAA